MLLFIFITFYLNTNESKEKPQTLQDKLRLYELELNKKKGESKIFYFYIFYLDKQSIEMQFKK